MHANFEAKIYAKVAGYLKELRVDIGQKVRKDEVLGVIWVPEMDRNVETQEKTVEHLIAEEKCAEAGLALAKANLAASKITVAQAEADIIRSQGQLAADSAEFKRVEDLVASKVVDSRVRDETRYRQESSRGARRRPRPPCAPGQGPSRRLGGQDRGRARRPGRCPAETSVARKKLEELKVMDAYALLRSPFDGVITERSVELGDLVRTAPRRPPKRLAGPVRRRPGGQVRARCDAPKGMPGAYTPARRSR